MVSALRWGAVTAAVVVASAGLATANHHFPPKPEGVTTVPVKDGYGSTLSYKETSICETTPGVKGYAGYIHLPAALTGESFDINTFYWYFQARESPETAQTVIYLAGGPGESSMYGAASQGGPCRVNSDSNSTTLNPWSWNNVANLLYIDQPVQTGFSYDYLVNGTLNQFTGEITPMDFGDHVPQSNATYLVGTFPSQSQTNVTAGSGRGANALWHFMQIWTEHFPEYLTHTEHKISLWANSWGGFYGLQTFQFFEYRNRDIVAGKSKAKYLELDTLGIINGCMDSAIEAYQIPQIATNNTYGYHYYNDTVRDEVEFNTTACEALITSCRTTALALDPHYNGNVTAVNDACELAFADCFLYVQGAFAISGHSPFDMSQQIQAPLPDNYPLGYFNRAWVQKELGVPVNFTGDSLVVQNEYAVTVGDSSRTNVTSLAFLLDSGIKAALVFGDRDYRCNWLGGEAVSLAADWTHGKAFHHAGYANLITNSSYTGGYVRQTGGMSFSRIFEAGHAAMWFQPETVFRVFERSLDNKDIATGDVAVPWNSTFQSTGPATVRAVDEKLPPEPPYLCNLYAISTTCTDNQIDALIKGTAVIDNFTVVKPAR